MVIHTDSDGKETPLDKGFDYEVYGIGNNNGGTIMYPLNGLPNTILPDDEKITLHRVVPLTQLTDITTGGRFDPRVHENVFDLMTMGLQQLEEKFERTFLLNISADAETSGVFPVPEPDTILGWNDDGSELQNYSIPLVKKYLESNLDPTGASPNDIPYYDGVDIVFGNVIQGLTVSNGNVTGSIVTAGTISGAAISGGTLTGTVVSGGTIDGTPIGDTTPAAGTFSALTTTGNLTVSSGTGKIVNGSSGAIAHNDADDFVVETSASGGMSILTPDAQSGRLYFGTSTDTIGGFLTWDHSNNIFYVASHRVGAKTELRGDNSVPNITLSGGIGSEVATFSGDAIVEGLVVTGNASTTLTNVDGTIRGEAIETAIAGAGLELTAGVLSVVSGGEVSSGDVDITGSSTNDILYNNGSSAAWGPVSAIGFDYSSDGVGVLPNANVADDLTISGGSIDNSIIGAVTPAAGTFTALDATGLTITSGSALIQNGLSGVTAHANADDLVLENSGHSGVSILSADASFSLLYFGSPGDSIGAQVAWNYSTKVLRAGSATAGGIFELESDAGVNNLILSGGAGTEVATFVGDVVVSGGGMELGVDNTLNGGLAVYGAATGHEGAQIDLHGAGSYPNFSLDAYYSQFRLYTIEDGQAEFTLLNAGSGTMNLNLDGGDLTVTGNSMLNGSVYAGGGTTSSQRALVSAKSGNRGEIYLRDLSAGFSTGDSTTDGTYLSSEGGLFAIAGQNDSGVGVGHVLTVDQPSGNVVVELGDLEISDGTMHIISSAGSGSPGADAIADNLLIEQGHNVGMSLHCPNNRTSTYMFGTQSLARAAEVQYDYTGNTLRLRTHRAGAQTSLGADDDIANLVLSGGSGSELASFAGDVHADGQVCFESGASLAVSSNAITVTHSTHTITNTANLQTINGFSDGADLVLLVDTTQTLTVEHGAANIRTNTAADVVFAAWEAAHFRYNGGIWYLLNGTNP